MYSCCDYDDYSLLHSFWKYDFQEFNDTHSYRWPTSKEHNEKYRATRYLDISYVYIYILNISIIFIGLSAKIYMTFNNILTDTENNTIYNSAKHIEKIEKEQTYIYKRRVFFIKWRRTNFIEKKPICIAMMIILVIMIIPIRQGCVWLFLLNAGNTFIWHRPALLSKVWMSQRHPYHCHWSHHQDLHYRHWIDHKGHNHLHQDLHWNDHEAHHQRFFFRNSSSGCAFNLR